MSRRSPSHRSRGSGRRSGQVQETGGKLGTFKKGELLPEIDYVAFQLPEKTISQVVVTDFGHHLLYVPEARNLQQSLCAELPEKQYDQYHTILYNQKRATQLTEFLSGLRERAEIVIN